MSPDSLFTTQLTDTKLWPKLAEWLKLPSYNNISFNVHSHKKKEAFLQKHLLLKK